MIVEKSFKKAKLTGQGGISDNVTLDIIPHPVIGGCCVLTIMDSREDSINASITVNNSELKRAAKLLCEVGIDTEMTIVEEN